MVFMDGDDKGGALRPDDVPGLWPDGAGALAVAVSGGPDSMALLWLAAQAGRGAVHALTVDHALRPDSAAEAAQVGRWAAGWPGVIHTVLTRDTIAPGRVMERAREDRYALMAAYCRAHGIGALLTAHHRDDQAETFLFRLAKGSGIDGLAGMAAETAYDGRLMLRRPLLSFSKERLIATCDDNEIPFVRDPTNVNPAFARSRLRAAMDVLGAEGLNTKRLATTALRLRRAREALEHYAARAFVAATIAHDEDRITLDAAILQGEPCETQRRVLTVAMTALRTPDAARGYGPRMETLEELSAGLFAADVFPRASLGGFLFSRKNGRVIVEIE